MNLRQAVLLSCTLVLCACFPNSASVGEGASASSGMAQGDGTATSSATSTATSPSATSTVASATLGTTSPDSATGQSSGSSDASAGEATGNGCAGDGLCGCAPPPSCDRGELIGSVVVDEDTTDLTQYEGYTSISGWIEISRGDIECLNFLACVEEVGHDVTIFGNDQLRDVSGLDGLRRLGTETADLPEAGPGVECPCRDGTFVFSENDGIEVFDGLHVVTEMFNINIAENANLMTLAGLDALTTTGTVDIRFNPSLLDVSQFLEGLDEARSCSLWGPQLCRSQAEALCASIDEDSVNVNGTDKSC